MNIEKTLVDKVVGYISPKAGIMRMQYKLAARVYEQRAKQVSGLRRYDGASQTRRTAGWDATNSSATSEIQRALSFLRNRSRELARNNPYAENAIREIANNMVGTGIMPKPIGLSKMAEKRLKQTWKDWAESTECDHDGHLNYYGIQHLAARTIVESGEVIIRKHINGSLDFPLQLQILEPDYIDLTKYGTGMVDGGYILYGVEFDKNNKVVAYWLWDHHPGDAMRFAIKSSRVPAEEVIHVFEKKRPGQFRGVPFGHSAMLRLKDLESYEDAQLVRQQIAACFTVFVTDNEIGGMNASGSEEEEPLEKVQPGIIEHLPAGKQVTMANPPDAGANYDPYVKSVLRGVASGYGMDYVTLTGDLTAVNFSSGRMGWLKFHRNVSTWQWNMLVPQFCNKSWGWFIEIANITGAVKQLKVKASWTPPRREMIDPVKEIEGMKMSIRAGLSSLQDAIRASGEDPDEVMNELEEMGAILDKNGLMLESDPRFDANRKLPIPLEKT